MLQTISPAVLRFLAALEKHDFRSDPSNLLCTSLIGSPLLVPPPADLDTNSKNNFCAIMKMMHHSIMEDALNWRSDTEFYKLIKFCYKKVNLCKIQNLWNLPEFQPNVVYEVSISSDPEVFRCVERAVRLTMKVVPDESTNLFSIEFREDAARAAAAPVVPPFVLRNIRFKAVLTLHQDLSLVEFLAEGKNIGSAEFGETTLFRMRGKSKAGSSLQISKKDVHRYVVDLIANVVRNT